MCWREVVYRSGYFNLEPYRGCAFPSSVVLEGSVESTVWKHLLCCVVDPPFFRVSEATCQESKQGSFSGYPLGEKGMTSTFLQCLLSLSDCSPRGYQLKTSHHACHLLLFSFNWVTLLCTLEKERKGKWMFCISHFYSSGWCLGDRIEKIKSACCHVLFTVTHQWYINCVPAEHWCPCSHRITKLMWVMLVFPNSNLKISGNKILSWSILSSVLLLNFWCLILFFAGNFNWRSEE